MTVTSLPVRDEFTGSAGQTVFNYTFLIFASGDLNVFITPAGQDANDATDITTAFTVDPGTIGNPLGGFITLNSGVSAGDLVTIVSNIPENRTIDYQNSGDFRPDTVNGDFDRVVSLTKQTSERASRALAFEESVQNTTNLTLDAPAALEFLRWKADKSGVESIDLAATGLPSDSSVITYKASNNFTGGVSRTVEKRLGDSVSIRDLGAVGDGVTDDTAAFHLFRDNAATGQELFVPAGTYLANITGWNFPIRGVGANASIIRAFNTASSVITLARHTPFWMWYGIEGVQFDGVDKTSPGVDFGADEFTGQYHFSNCEFVSCSFGVFKPSGNIGNKYTNCHFFGNDQGYRAIGLTPSPIMQAGADIFEHCEWDNNTSVSVYIDSPTGGTGQSIFNSCLFQGEPGFVFFIEEYKTSFVPITLNDCWMEAVATSGSVTVDSVSYNPTSIRLKDCTQFIMNRSSVVDIELVGNSALLVDGCFVNTISTFVQTTSDVIRVKNVHTDNYKGQICESVNSVTRKSGSAADVYIAPPRSEVTLASTMGATLISGADFADEEAFAWTGTTTETGRIAPDGILFDGSCEITIPDGNTNFGDGTGGTITSGRHYVWSVDIKPLTANIPTFDVANGTTLATGLDSEMVLNEWNTRAGITEAQTTGTIGLKVVNTTGSVSTFRASAYQVVEFTRRIDAVDYYNKRLFITANQRRVIQGDAIPTTGAWIRGDRIEQILPSAAGKIGFVCVTSGTPGTWKPFGVIDA